MLKILLLLPISFFFLEGSKFWLRKCYFCRLFMTCILIFCGFCFWSAGLVLWCKGIFFNLSWNLTLFAAAKWGFGLFDFLLSSSWIWIIKSDSLLSVNAMVFGNALPRWPPTSNVKWTWRLLFSSSATAATSSRYKVLSVEYFFDQPLAFYRFPNFSWLIVRTVLIWSSDAEDDVYLLVLSC